MSFGPIHSARYCNRNSDLEQRRNTRLDAIDPPVKTRATENPRRLDLCLPLGEIFVPGQRLSLGQALMITGESVSAGLPVCENLALQRETLFVVETTNTQFVTSEL